MRKTVKREQVRLAGLLTSAALGIVISLATALALVPRVKAVEVFTVFASAFGAGAALTAAIIVLKSAKTPSALRGLPELAESAARGNASDGSGSSKPRDHRGAVESRLP